MKETIITYSVNSNEPADILFQDIKNCQTEFNPDNFSQMCVYVQFGQESQIWRQQARKLRNTYGEKFRLIDINETYRVWLELAVDKDLLDHSEVFTSKLISSMKLDTVTEWKKI